MSKSQSVAPEGRPTHGVKIRVQGVNEGSAEHQRVLNQLQGHISQFLGKNQQQVALGGLEQHASRTKVPGASLRYKNNQGQETLDVVVEHKEGGEEKVESKEEYWSWAIVEMRVPNIQGLTTFVASAFMNPPPKNKEGYAVNKTHPIDTDKPPLSYPIDELGTFIGDVQDNDGYASLRVDLRPYPGGVKFDLYGYIRKYTTTGPGPNTSSAKKAARKAGSVSVGGSTYVTGNGVSGSWYSTGDIAGRTIGNVDWANTTTIANIQTDFPSLVGATFNSSISPGTLNFLYPATSLGSGPSYAGTTFVWTPGSGNMPTAASLNVSALISAAGGLFTETTTFGADGIVKEVRGLGAMDFNGSGALNGAGPTDADGTWGISFFDYHLYWVGDHPTVTTNVFPDRTCPISFVVLDDGPDGMTNRYGSPLKDNSYRWEITKKYPARWPMKQFPNTAFMQAVDDSGFASPTKANHYSMIKLGTVIINPKKGKGGIKFIAA